MRTTIFTLNARGNVMLEVMRDYFNMTPKQMHREIRGLHNETVSVLASKGINYADLKSALVPSPTRREIALFFDTMSIDEGWYGLQVHNRIMPLFAKESNHSVLTGDYIGDNEHQDALFNALREKLVPAREVRFRHSSQFYIVYINNLSDRMFNTFAEGLQDYRAYAGHADLSYGSILKYLISNMLPVLFLKHRNIVLMSHEDDRDNKEDINLPGYPFEESGYICKSVQEMLFGVLLNYKIERPVLARFESDTEFSINAVSPEPIPLSEFDIVVDERKYGYLTREKIGTLKRSGLFDKGAEGLKQEIARKLSSNYIYNMTFDDRHDTTKFDILLEVHPTDGGAPVRVLVALEYLPDNKRLRLITLH